MYDQINFTIAYACRLSDCVCSGMEGKSCFYGNMLIPFGQYIAVHIIVQLHVKIKGLN